MVSNKPLYFTCVYLWVEPFLWYQGQGCLSRSRSIIKVTLLKKLAVMEAFLFQKHSLSYPHKTCFQEYTGISLSVCVSVSPSVCPYMYKILLSVKVLVGVSSHIQ